MKLAKADAIFIVAIIAFAISQISLTKMVGPIANEALGLQLTFSADQFSETVQGWSAEEMQNYLRQLRWDYLHLVIYGFALWWGVFRLNQLRPLNPRMRKALYAAPILAGLLDVVEDSIHLWMLNAAPDLMISQPWVAIAAIAALAKWILALGTLAYLAWNLPRAYSLRG